MSIASAAHAAAIEHLHRCDPVLRPLLKRVGHCTMKPRKDYFPALCEAIINQQISAQAGASITRKVKSLFPRGRLNPSLMARLTDEQLRASGISPQKLRYLRDLSVAFTNNTIPVRKLPDMSDEEVIQALTLVKGIGQWTAQMFLIFVLNRPDVLATGDLSLKKSVRTLYKLRKPPTEKQFIRVADPWRPYRSYASWYLWMAQH